MHSAVDIGQKVHFQFHFLNKLTKFEVKSVFFKYFILSKLKFNKMFKVFYIQLFRRHKMGESYTRKNIILNSLISYGKIITFDTIK